jgi:hypothetical protein
MFSGPYQATRRPLYNPLVIEARRLSKWPTDIKLVQPRMLPSLSPHFVFSYTPIVQKHMYPPLRPHIPSPPSHRDMDGDGLNLVLGDVDPIDLLANGSSYG